MRVIGEWPPSYVVFPADDAREHLAEVLAPLLERPFPTVLPRWRMTAKEARKLVEFCPEEEEQEGSPVANFLPSTEAILGPALEWRRVG